jgi:hypothetical protein
LVFSRNYFIAVKYPSRRKLNYIYL